MSVPSLLQEIQAGTRGPHVYGQGWALPGATSYTRSTTNVSTSSSTLFPPAFVTHGVYSRLRCVQCVLIRHHQLIFSVFKTLTDQTVTVELKNDLSITGVLKSVDQWVLNEFIRMFDLLCLQKTKSDRFLNIRLDNIKVLDEARHPHMVRLPGLCDTLVRWLLRFVIDGCEKLLYPRICREICTASCGTCWHTIAWRRHATRYALIHDIYSVILIHMLPEAASQTKRWLWLRLHLGVTSFYVSILC